MEEIIDEVRDRSYRGRIGTQIKPSDINLPQSIIDKKNKDKSWLYREYPEYDINFVCISKDGTLGEIWKVGDLYIGLPSVEGKEIVNKDVPDDLAKWKREENKSHRDFQNLWFSYKAEMAKEKNGIRRTKVKEKFVKDRDKLIKEHQEFVDSEYHKREYGIFIKIDNEVHYVSGELWMFLQHYYLTESNMYGYFRVVAMEALWHWEACRADTRVWGEIRGKGRRTSWSVESASIALNVFTITKYAEIPIVSERKDLASKLFTGKIVNSFEYYPIYFKPIIDLPNTQVSSNLQITFETQRREVSTIDFYPTKSTAYDSMKVKNVSINDEIGKWENESLTEFIARHSRCHLEGGATGRFGSTAGKYSDGGGEEFEAEYVKADATKRNKLGRTDNGLVSFFIDVCYTMTQPISYFDEWGYSIVHDPKHPIYNESGLVIEFGAITDWTITFNTLKEQGKKTSLNAFLRDMPRETSHMFRNEGGMHNDFDINNLNNHLDYLQQLNEHDLADIVYRGNLVWEGEKFTSNVQWIPNTNGKFFSTWLPEKQQQNKSSVRLFHGKKLQMPDNVNIGVLGIDSYDISSTVDGVGSNGAIAGYTKFNMAGAPSNSFFLKYTERPDKRDDFYEDVCKACKFFGMMALVESNKPRLLEYMKDNGFRGYSMTRPDKKWRDLSVFEREHGGIPSSKQTNKDQASLLKDYIMDFVGSNLETDCKVFFKDAIEEFIKFDVNKRTKFDLSVSFQLALLGSQYMVKQRKHEAVVDRIGLSISSFGA